MPTEKDPTKLKAEELEKRVAPTLMYSEDTSTDPTTTEAKGSGKTSTGSVSGGSGKGGGPVDVEQP